MIIEDTINDFRRELKGLGYSKTAVDNYPKYAQKLLEYTKETALKITDQHIKNYYEYLKVKPSRTTKKIISQSHIYSQLLAIKLYFEYLERTKTIKRNPYTLRIKQTAKNERIVLSQEEIKLLYESCLNIVEKTILHLCYGCGLRRNEVELLNLKDVNFEQKLLFIRKGKGKKRRVIPLTEAIVKDLSKYCNDIEIYRKETQESFLISSLGTPVKGSTIYKTFKKVLQRTQSLKPENYCLHSLRHSIATHLLENEMSIEMVRDFLGHSQLVSTQIYTRINFLKTKLHQ
ncbi:tyrosine-type recombinase/integrase [Flavobacterium ajazii]|uniref:tyrosine-type recombinase/integrase n=1 Tax=Flavobacterium ajazii TaxID=2692318 RepID=UPI0013D5E852|nr:tyrosine-type recombinase/integrase [Flavobacterium ajazii]